MSGTCAIELRIVQAMDVYASALALGGDSDVRVSSLNSLKKVV